MHQPRAGLRHVVLIRLIASQICVHASMAGMRMSSPLWALHLGYSAWSVGLLLSLFALASVFLALPAGRFADRHGLRRPVALSVTAAAAGAGLPAVWPVFPVLCAGALLTGAGTGVMLIALQRYIGRSARDSLDLKRVFGWLSVGPALSNFLGPLMAGLMIDHAGVWLGGQAAGEAGYRVAFLVLALIPLVAWWGIRIAPEHVPSSEQLRKSGRRAWDLLLAPKMRQLLLVNWILSSSWDVHTFVVPLIGHERGLSASVIGSILGGFALSATIVRALLPLMAHKVREAAVIRIAMMVTAAMFFLYPLMSLAWAMGICSVVLGLALGSVQPMIMSTLHQITPDARHGEALGLRMMAINASSVLMPAVFGAAGAAVGVSVVFWTVGGIAGLGSELARRLGRSFEGSHQEPSRD